MASSNLYELFFVWPSTAPSTVVVTGTFDQWSKSKHLNKTARGFVGTVWVPWGEKIKYKFIVDGQWLTLKGQPTETDPGGYVNNVLTTPSKPVSNPSVSTTGAELQSTSEPVKVEEAEPNKDPNPANVASPIVARLPIPIVPVNAAEHSTVGSAPTQPPPDFVLPPPSRATPSEAAKMEDAESITKAVDPATATAPSSSTAARLPIPIIPVNAAEHSTVGSAPSQTPPDFVLPPPNRATSGEVAEVEDAEPAKQASEAAAAGVPSSETTPRLPIPIVPVNAAEHSTVGSTLIQPPPDFVLPPPSRATSPASMAQPTVVASTTQKPADVEPVQAMPSATSEVKTSPEVPKTDGASVTPSNVPNATPSSKEEAKVNGGTTNGTPLPSPSKSQGKPEATSANLPTPPSTPKKTLSGRSNSPAPSSTFGSPTSSKFGSMKKKRRSLIGKLKDIFHHHDKNKDEENNGSPKKIK